MRQRTKKEQPAKKLIQKVATRLFAKEGFDSVSIMDICNEAGVNNSMVSYYFGGKMELYESIIGNMHDKQIEYLNSLIKIEDFRKLSIKEKSTEFNTVLDKFIDFFYTEVSTDIIMLILREQQNPLQNKNILERVPWIIYLRELLADMMNLQITSEEIVFHIMSIVAIMTSPRIFSTLLSSLLNNKNLSTEHIEMIRKNLKNYVSVILKFDC